MENFEELVFKLVETQPNKPLNSATKTLLQCRLNQFASEYKTPDHPPYSSMIEMALGELNEKKGSSVESISQHIERNYNNLPFAHSVLLKHHLEKLCETGEIIVTRDKRYGLPGRLKLTTRRRRRRKWRYDSERIMYNSRKQKLMRNSRKADENEQRVTENGGNKSGQTKLEFDPSSFKLIDAESSRLTEIDSEKKSDQSKLESGPSGFELVDVESSRLTDVEIAYVENLDGPSTLAMRWQNRSHGKQPAVALTSLKSKETSQDEEEVFNSSSITMNREETEDGLPVKFQRLRVVFKARPDIADVLIHYDSKQTVQPTKRRRGRPPKTRPLTNA